LDCRIEASPSFEIIGKSLETTMRDGRMFQDIPEFWARCDEDGTTSWLTERMGPLGILGVSMDNEPGISDFRYFAAVQAPREDVEFPPGEGWSRRTLPACTWGKFDAKGPLPLTLQCLVRDVYTKWMPHNGEWELAGLFNVSLSPIVPPGMRKAMAGSIHGCGFWVPLKRIQA